ncbi:MAG: hypothetical protein F6K24_27505 [Okeania sp. SIO2D1]|nr:hypothetical protein [Okeania sp. SIO2D1]
MRVGDRRQEAGGRRQETGGRRQETGDNPPLTPPRRGKMGIIEEVGGIIVRVICLP